MSIESNSSKYPKDEINLCLMNKVMRHRLRNLCAGVKMTVDRISSTTAGTHPQIPSRCKIIASELDNLELFTERMDLLFDAPPKHERKSLFEVITELREFFSKSFAFNSLEFVGAEENIVIEHGTWIFIALKELLKNAGEASENNAAIKLSWTKGTGLEFSIANSSGKIPDEIPIDPPAPFNTLRSRHDGIGLAIAWRFCKETDSEMTINNNLDDGVEVKIKLPQKELVDE